MTATSYFKKLVGIQSSYFVDGAPISTAHAFLARNNVAHMIDESCQHRVNFSRTFLDAVSTTMGPILVRSNDLGQPWPSLFRQWEFPLTWLAPDKPANLDLVVGFTGEDNNDDEDITCRVVICPANVPVKSGQNALLDTSVTAASPGSSISAYVLGADNLPTLADAWEVVGATEEAGFAVQPRLCMLRLEVDVSWNRYILVPTEEDFITISFVHLVEYA